MNVYFKISIAAIVSFMISLVVYIPLVLQIEKLEYIGTIAVPNWMEALIILFFFILVAIFYPIASATMRIHQKNPEIELGSY